MSGAPNPRGSRMTRGAERPRSDTRVAPRSHAAAASDRADTTAPLRTGDEDDGEDDNGLMLGFEHRMNTDERRLMRERERAAAEEDETRTKSSSPSGRVSSRPGTSSTGATSYSSSNPRYAGGPSRSSSTVEPSGNKSSTRRTAYSRELDKRDRARDGTGSRRSSDDRSHRSGDRNTPDDSSKRSEASNRRRHDTELESSVRREQVRRRNSASDELETSSRREHESSRRRDLHDDIESSSRRNEQPSRGERSPQRHPDSKPRENKYRSKSRDATMDETDEERRRRREERRRRERQEYERGGGDNDEERSRRSYDRRRQERGGDREYEDEDRRRRREADRRAREDKRAARRATECKSGDDSEPFDRAERDRKREERRKDRAREYDDDRSARSGRKERDSQRGERSARDPQRDRMRSARSRSSDPDILQDDRYSERDGSMPSRSRASDPPPLGRARSEAHSERGVKSRRDRGERDRKSGSVASNSRSSERLERLAEGDSGGPKMRVVPFSSRMSNTSHEDEVESGAEEEEGLIGASPGPSESSSESESEEESVADEADEESSVQDDEELWTVRVCLISAIDLPFNVVPNVPLCPILKFGLVRILTQEVEALNPLGPDTSIGPKRTSIPKFGIAEQIEKEGLLSVPKARIRSTSGKILSKRDIGSMEFHEEMRWDDVTRPEETALAIELCARAALPPPNLFESPLVKIPKTSPLVGITLADIPDGVSSISATTRNKAFPAGQRPGVGLSNINNNDDYDDIFQRAIGKAGTDMPAALPLERRTESEEIPNTGPDFGVMGMGLTKQEPEKIEEEYQEEDEDEDDSQPYAGIAGMRALWRKGRQQFEQRQATKRKNVPDEMEAASAAAAVAQFLVGGNEADGRDGPTEGGVGEVAENTESMPRSDVFRNPSLGVESPTAPSSLAASIEKRLLPHERNARSGDENVALIRPKKRRKVEMAKDMRLASLVIPLTMLPLAKATDRKEAARVEQWYQLDVASNTLVPVHTPSRRGLSTASKLAARRNPSVLLEISFSAPEVLDESEDELEIDSEGEQDTVELGGIGQAQMEDISDSNISFSRRASLDMKKQQKAVAAKEEADKPVEEKAKVDDPVLEPGVCDFIAIVGAINVGDQCNDIGNKGWVKSNPECSILEQFPPNDEFHHGHGRNVGLMHKSEWWCFPEGWKLWRGAEPPSHTDLKLKRFSASSPPNVASSIAAFDACLSCTTSFSWFVIQSNEKENDFKNTKTYGAVIKFYAPAPPGIDSTQDDFASGMRGGSDLHQGKRSTAQAKRLWVPLGILMTSNLPIVGIMEAMLLRLCEGLASRTGGSLHSTSHRRIQKIIHQDLANLIVNFQKPIPGVLHCSIPFLTGERLHLTVPPPTGLPALPHGSSVTSVCRLLGSEGLNVILAAVLTECKILIHSDEIANLAMVAEVITALIYPFVWSLPYLPVLPEAMLEFVEAPLSFFIGIPSCKMRHIGDDVLVEIVVIDLDNGFTSPDYYDGRRSGRPSKAPTPLPASVASNISKAVFRLLREEEEVEEEYGANNMHGTRSLPRLEAESLAEREFRIAVALQICGLVRGYDECLFKVSASQPVFNRDKFLRTAPALFEDRRGNVSASAGQFSTQSQKMLSPRSKRFLSILVNCQHFYQFLETLDQDECKFFNEVMYTFDMNEDKKDDDAVNPLAGYGSAKLEEAAAHLSKALQKVEDKIPTYRVDRKGKKKRRGGGGWDDGDDGGIEDLIETHDTDHDIGFSDDGNLISSFTSDLLQQLTVDPSAMRPLANSSDGDDMTFVSEMSESRNQGAMAAQFLAEFEKGNHWDYKKLFDIPIETDGEKQSLVELRDKVKLRDAIGERRYRAWKVAQEQKNADKDNTGRMFTGDISSTEGNTALDLTSLLSQVADDAATAETASVSTLSSFSTQSRKMSSSLTPEQQRVQDAKDKDVVRRCLERAYEGGTAQRRPTRFARRGSGTHSQPGNDPFARRGSGPPAPTADPFFENGRDLIADAEAALRNPSAQKFLISVLSQRSKTENQRKRRSGADDRGRRGGNQPTLSRLEAPAFDCLVRLCGAMLDTCLENRNYEAGFNLLNQTQGFCTLQSKDGKPLSKKEDALDNANVIYMTSSISLHLIFAELELWEGVLQMKLDEGERERKDNDESDSKDDLKDSDQIDYDTTVSTLYEMLGFGVPSEELARFATCVSEKKGWFATDRGQNLLLQARRLSSKQESGSAPAASGGDWDMMRGGKMQEGNRGVGSSGAPVDVHEGKMEWKVIGWCHPAATTFARPPSHIQREAESNAPPTSRVGQNLLNMIGNEQKEEEADANKHLKRSAVTSLAAFGPSIVASGGLDGSVFVAHTIQFPEDNKNNKHVVRGVRLDWGSSGSRTAVVGSGSSSMDGEYGVGAVSCLAAAKGAGYRNTALSSGASSYNKDVGGKPDDNDILQAMEGCRVVAGTTGGDLRVWSVKEVYAATALAKMGDPDDVSEPMSQMRLSGGKRESITDIAAGYASSRLKVSLRGRALSGHRGGVTCIDVPSHIYRPDALVTGGADGLIKLWSLRSPTGRRASGGEMLGGGNPQRFNTANMVPGGASDSLSQTRTKGSKGGDALSILSGHTGRVLCVKTAWHGDRLLSGGADRSVRIWDLAGAGGTGKCLQELRGHLGWVTQSHYWGPNTIVSASTDRAIALWDARVKGSPLFILRYHKSPVSDLLVGSRTDPLMVSAAADGTVATWDFRSLSGSTSEAVATTPLTSSAAGKTNERKCSAVRTPASTMTHGGQKGVKQQAGTVLLSRGPGRQRKTVQSIGVDAVVREWDIASGKPIRHHSTNHVDVVSCFHSFFDSAHGSGVEPGEGASAFAGSITSSWDGTIRMRTLVKK